MPNLKELLEIFPEGYEIIRERWAILREVDDTPTPKSYHQWKQWQIRDLKQAILDQEEYIRQQNKSLTETKHNMQEALDNIGDYSLAGTELIYQMIIDDIEERKDQARKIIKRLTWEIRSWKGEQLPEGQIGPEQIAAAKRVPIQDFVATKLRKTGGKLWTTCPFHLDKTPSFCIYLNQNTFACYSCNTAGDSIDYIMKSKNLSFIEAVKLLIN